MALYKYKSPLSNEDRIFILQLATGSSARYITQLERIYFGVTSYYRNEMREKMRARVGDPYAENFDAIYDEFLLSLYQDLINQNSGQPVGLLLALTQA